MIKLMDILLENEEIGALRDALTNRGNLPGTSEEVKDVIGKINHMHLTSFRIPQLDALMNNLTQTKTDEEFEQVLRDFEKKKDFARGKINRMAIGKYIGIITNRQK